MIDLEAKYSVLLDQISKDAPFEPETAIILGSGLGEFAQSLETLKSIETTSLNGYPKSTVEGHKGFIHFCKHKDKKLLLFQGRIHFYEGYKISECVLPVLIARHLGCKVLLLTNAAGGVNPDFEPGDLMLITSTNSVNIKKELTELIGLASLDQRNAFLSFPSPEINDIIRRASLDEKVFLKEGTYFYGKGPMYETPAEIKMAAKLGGDAVGMSTVHEAVFGAVLGMKVAGISCITNLAAGISPVKLDHQEVVETGRQVKDKFERLIKRVVELT